MKRILTIVLSALMLSACMANWKPGYQSDRTGETDESYSRTSAAASYDCRMPQGLPGSRLGQVCKTSAEWTRYPGYGMDATGASAMPVYL